MAYKTYKKGVRIMLIMHVLIKNEIKWTNMISIFKNCGLNVLFNVLIHENVLQLVQMCSIRYITRSSPLFSFSRQVALRSPSISARSAVTVSCCPLTAWNQWVRNALRWWSVPDPWRTSVRVDHDHYYNRPSELFECRELIKLTEYTKIRFTEESFR